MRLMFLYLFIIVIKSRKKDLKKHFVREKT
jgi:hypothetical protein